MFFSHTLWIYSTLYFSSHTTFTSLSMLKLYFFLELRMISFTDIASIYRRNEEMWIQFSFVKCCSKLKCEFCTILLFYHFSTATYNRASLFERQTMPCIYCIVETLAIACNNCLWLDIPLYSGSYSKRLYIDLDNNLCICFIQYFLHWVNSY